MTMEARDNKTSLAYAPRFIIGLGGAGTRVARLAYEGLLLAILKLLGSGSTKVENLRRDLATVIWLLGLDSEAAEGETIAPSFANEAGLILPPPDNYVVLESYSGSELIELAETPPFAHLERSSVPLSEIEGKRSRCEAQQNRLYGKVNVEANIQLVERAIEKGVEQCYTADKTAAWLRLIERGLRLDPKLPVISIFFSTAGGQGSGAVLLVLALLALQLEGRPRPRVYLHLLLPGFHPSTGEQEELNNALRTQAVLHDLAALKQGAEMRIPLPHGDRMLNSKHFLELFDALFIHAPMGDRKEAYENIARRVSNLAVSLELAAFAKDATRSRSNVPQFEQQEQEQRRIAACEGVEL